jgi:MFS transporter, YQGE family, putative transporter
MHRHEKEFPHNQSVEGFVASFKHTRLSGALTALYSNRILQQVASGLIGIFFPILLYTKFDFSIYAVALYYFINWTLWFFTVPIGAKIMSRIGLKYSLIFSVMIGWAWYYFVRLFEMHGILAFLGLAIIVVNFDRMLYWVPYHTSFAEFTDRRTRGKQMSFLISIASIVSIAIPFISGQIISQYGYDVLFIIALVLYVMSVIPLFLMPSIKENFSFGYFETFKKVFCKKNRKMLLAYAADGMQGMVGMVIWPIFIWLLLDKDYSSVGLVASLIIVTSLFLRLIMGNLADRFDKRRVLKWGALLSAIGWMVKMFVQSGFQIFVASTYHSFATIVMRTPFDALMYEKAADSGHYVDEYTVIREMCLTFGRLLMLGIICLIFFLTGSFILAFFVAGLASLVVSV